MKRWLAGLVEALKDRQKRQVLLRRAIFLICCMFVGALLGLGVWGIWFLTEEYGYIAAAIVGAIVAPFGAKLYRWFTQTGRSLRIETFTVNLPLVGETEVIVSDEHRAVGWKLFVESMTRIATQTLGEDEGFLHEAKASLYSIFQTTRDELKSMRPSPPPLDSEDYTVELYAARMLNEALRPFLARWHPRMERWGETERPESQWALAPLCREDLAATRDLMLRFTWGLGRMLRVPHLDQLLPLEPTGEPPALIGEVELKENEEALNTWHGASRQAAGWHIFVELASRIGTQRLEPGTGSLRGALDSLYALFGIVREKLTEIDPAELTGTPDERDTVEVIALRILNGPLRQFLAKWHPIVDQHEKAERVEADWPDGQSEQCRQELETTRQAILADVVKLGELVGIPQLDRKLPVE